MEKKEWSKQRRERKVEKDVWITALQDTVNHWRRNVSIWTEDTKEIKESKDSWKRTCKYINKLKGSREKDDKTCDEGRKKK